jgi:hypothetical protein
MFDFLSNNWRFASDELGSPPANQPGVREQPFSVRINQIAVSTPCRQKYGAKPRILPD